MTPVRPNIVPTAASGAPQRADAARLTAQKAFFDAAMGRTAAPAAPAAPAPTVSQQAAPARPSVQRLPEPGAPAPARILRPGSILDIRV